MGNPKKPYGTKHRAGTFNRKHFVSSGTILSGREPADVKNVTEIRAIKGMPTPGKMVKVSCWCEKKIMEVEYEIMRAGKTISCGRENCHG